MKIISALALTLFLSGCFAPPLVSAISLALDGVSYMISGKSVPDHGLSMLANRDCRMFRVLTGGGVCRPYDPSRKPKAPVEVAAQVQPRDMASLSGVTHPMTLKAGSGPTVKSTVKPAAIAAATPATKPLRGGAPATTQLAANSSFTNPSFKSAPLPSAYQVSGEDRALPLMGSPVILSAVEIMPAGMPEGTPLTPGAIPGARLTAYLENPAPEPLLPGRHMPTASEYLIESFGDKNGAQSVELIGDMKDGPESGQLYARLSQAGDLEVYLRKGDTQGGLVAPENFKRLFTVAGYAGNPENFTGVLVDDVFLFVADFLDQNDPHAVPAGSATQIAIRPDEGG